MSGAAPIKLDPLVIAFFSKPKRGAFDISGQVPQSRSQGRSASRSAGRAFASVKGRAVSAIQRIHNAYGVPQAVIKVTRAGRTFGGNALRNQLQYLGRGGEVAITDQNGAGIEAGGQGRYGDLVADWDADFAAMDKRATFGTYHLVVSYPKGTDPEAARFASERFACELTCGRYGDSYKYLLAHHRDTDYPHAHLILNRCGVRGSTLHLSRYGVSIQDLRELHVETARELGIMLNATSRMSRAVARFSHNSV